MMGWLARQDGYDPNAFDVPLEQSTGVGWANRLGEILTTRPPDNPAMAYKTPYFDITEGDIGRATEAAMGVSGGGMTTKPTFVNRGGGMFDARVGDQFAGTASLAGDGTKPFLSSVSVEPQFRGQGVGRGLYEQAEASLGRPLVPSPLGLSEDATRLWQKRLAAMEPKEARALVDEARQLGESYGLKPEQIKARFADLIKEQQGIRAYHSSPHDFDKFDLAKIGTGEGAQVYGHGLYFAESPAVSGQGGQYWNQFSERFKDLPTPEGMATRALVETKADRAAAIAKLSDPKYQAHLKGFLPNSRFKDVDPREALKLLESDQPVGPRTYEVNINADPARFLDWDKPLREQPKAVQAIADDVLRNPSRGTAGFLDDAYNPRFPASGGNLYEAMARRRPNPAYDPVKDPLGSPTIISHAGASDVLREAGIPGIKYLDQGSRGHERAIAQAEHYHQQALRRGDTIGAEQAKVEADRLKAAALSSNYVIFDPGIIDIMKKYGIAGATAVPVMGSLASEGNYQTEERY